MTGGAWRRLVWREALAAGAALLLVLLGLVFGRSPAAVDWQRVRAVALESDDWGLCGFVPDSSALPLLDREALDPGRFPPVYWHSTLEDSAAVAALSAVLAGHSGRDGLPAVLQPNYILASLAYAAGETAGWQVHELPDLMPAYARPGLWQAVRAAQSAGVWQPELHGRWHYDPGRRKAAVGSGAAAVRDAAGAQILPFPGSEAAWELGPWRGLDTVAAELDRNLTVFADLFGSRPRSIMAPDYVWDDRHERLWRDRGITIIQGHREQRRDAWRGHAGRAAKLLSRTWRRWVHHDRVYLERNGIFEPAQHDDPAAVTHEAIAAVAAAWRRGEPAILEVHRINFVHLDAALAAAGRQELDRLLAAVAAGGPLFVADREVAALQRWGTSWAVRGEMIVVRNLTRSRRLVVVPPEAVVEAARRAGRPVAAGAQPLVLALGPGETRQVRPAAAGGPGVRLR